MKQNLLNKLWLRVWMIVAVMTTALAGTAAADVVTLVSGSGTSGYAIPDGWTSSGTVEGGSYLKFDNGTITSPEFEPHTGLSFTYTVATFGSGTNHPLTVRILNASTNEVIIEKTTATPTSSTYISTDSPLALGDVDVAFKIQLYGPKGKGVRLRNYSITGTPAGGSSSLTASDLALTDASVELSFDLFDNSSAQVINYTTSSTGDVTVSESDYVSCEVNEEAGTITVTPVAVTPEAQTITVNQAADETYKAGSVTFTVTVTDSTPVPTHTATFSVNGETSTQEYAEGADIEFPQNPADVNGKTFVGWVAEAIEGTTDVAPEFVTSANMGQSDVTYYAVFAYANGGGSAEVVDVLDNDLTGITGTTYANWSGKTSKSDAVYAGNSAGSYGSIQLRSSNNNSGIITTTSGGKAKKVVVTWNSNTVAGRTIGVYGSTKAYESPSDLYSITSTSKQISTIVNGTSTELEITGDYEYIGIRSEGSALYLDKVEITWLTGGGVTYSGYCTTVVAAAVARPVIEVAENPFMFSTTATITCETEGAAIKYSFDGENWNDYTEALTITATTTIYAKAMKGNDESNVAQITATKNLAVPTVAIDATGITNTNVFDGTEAGSLAASVTYNDAAVEGATVTWSGNNDEVATIDENGAVTLVAAGTVTFTATYAGNEDYAEKTATYEMTVTNSDPNAPGTENNPYTVAEAVEFIGTLGTATSATEVYVSGIISQVDSYNSTYSSIQYWISDDGTTTGQMEVYSGKGLNGADFSSVDDLKVGDIVTVKGYVKMYKGTPEFDKNNILVSFERPVVTTPSIELGDNEINAFAEGTDGVIIVTYNNITEVESEVFFCDAEGNAATYDWVAASINSIGNLEYIIDANTSTEARTAYMKVYALDDNAKDVYSELITITQAGYVVDYATLPFAWDDKDTPTGITNYGVATYSSSPYLKFDGSGDEIILKLNEAPGVLFFDIKGNSFSGGTFTVQTSADDQTYDELATYTELGATQTEAFSLNSDVRYIKWIYTEKVSGNVALGNIIVDVAQVATVGAAKYATYVPKYNVSFPREVEAYITSEVNTEKGYVSMTQVTAVPKGTPVVLKNEGEYVLAPAAADALADVSSNQLKASDTDIEADGTQYVLAKPQDQEIGFYKATFGSTIAAGKAYLQIEGADVEVKGFTFKFDDDATAIDEIVNGKLSNGKCYNLAGQRVSKMQRGINIVNGKKILK